MTYFEYDEPEYGEDLCELDYRVGDMLRYAKDLAKKGDGIYPLLREVARFGDYDSIYSGNGLGLQITLEELIRSYCPYINLRKKMGKAEDEVRRGYEEPDYEYNRSLSEMENRVGKMLQRSERLSLQDKGLKRILRDVARFDNDSGLGLQESITLEEVVRYYYPNLDVCKRMDEAEERVRREYAA
jgi:hypothetical protein